MSFTSVLSSAPPLIALTCVPPPHPSVPIVPVSLCPFWFLVFCPGSCQEVPVLAWCVILLSGLLLFFALSCLLLLSSLVTLSVFLCLCCLCYKVVIAIFTFCTTLGNMETQLVKRWAISYWTKCVCVPVVRRCSTGSLLTLRPPQVGPVGLQHLCKQTDRHR